MQSRFAIALGTLSSLALWLVEVPPALAQTCKRYLAAEWPVRLTDGRPIVTGAINGRKVNIFVHTGAASSAVSKAMASRLGLRGEQVTADGRQEEVAQLDELRIGDFAVKGIRAWLWPDDPFPGVDFVLGNDFSTRFDVEFDFPGG